MQFNILLRTKIITLQKTLKSLEESRNFGIEIQHKGLQDLLTLMIIKTPTQTMGYTVLEHVANGVCR